MPVPGGSPRPLERFARTARAELAQLGVKPDQAVVEVSLLDVPQDGAYQVGAAYVLKLGKNGLLEPTGKDVLWELTERYPATEGDKPAHPDSPDWALNTRLTKWHSHARLGPAFWTAVERAQRIGELSKVPIVIVHPGAAEPRPVSELLAEVEPSGKVLGWSVVVAHGRPAAAGGDIARGTPPAPALHTPGGVPARGLRGQASSVLSPSSP